MRHPEGINRATRGFTLLELAIVIGIIATMTVVGVTTSSSMLDSAKKAATNNKLDTIELALAAYRMANNRLPCPAQMDLAVSNANYGIEAATPGTCTGGTPAANASYAIAADSSTVVEGGVPTTTLGLPSSFMYDAWGRKFVYAAWAPDTGTRAFLNYGITPNCGDITIKDAGGTARTTNAIYALLSVGPDGHGGYLPNGSRYNAHVANTDEDANTHYNSSGADTGGYAAAYVQKDVMLDASDATNPFQQIVRYKERWQMANAYDQYSPTGAICRPGFRADELTGYNSNPDSDFSVAFGDINGDGIADLIIGADSARPNGTQPTGAVYVLFGSRTGYTTPFLLSGLDGTNGFRIKISTNTAINVGASVAVADINGDGYADMIIGAPGASYGAAAAGSVYVVFGGPNAVSGGTWLPAANAAGVTTLNLDVLAGYTGTNGTSGFRLDSTVASEAIGWTVGSGKVNGDTKPSLLMGGQLTHTTVGPWYVVFDQASWTHATYTLDNVGGTNGMIDATHGIKITGLASGDSAHGTQITAGDLTGDGIDDIAIGVNNLDRVYVVYGHSGAWATPLDLTALTGASTGFKFTGPGTYLAIGLAIADINGDGKKDLIMVDGYGGITYVLYGKTGKTYADVITSASLTGAANGFKITGTKGGSSLCSNNAGFISAATADINGDGIPDIILGVPAGPTAGNTAGVTYVIYGSTYSGTYQWPSSFDVSTLNGSNGFALTGVGATQYSGAGVAVGDFTGDSVLDMAIYAPCYHALDNYSGSIFVLYGKRTSWSASYGLSNLN